MKQIIRLTESDLHRIVKESVQRILKEQEWDTHLQQDDDEPTSFEYLDTDDEWYSEEDYNGHQGQPGLIRSYDIGTVYDSNVEQEAKEMGFSNIADYLKYWFDEVKAETPWHWTQKSGGFKNTIFSEGGVVCQLLPGGQIVIDEYAPGEAAYENNFNDRLTKGEFWMK